MRALWRTKEESVDNSRLASTPISRSIGCKPSPRDAPSAALYSSASADEVATTFCVDDHVLNGCPPIITKPPDVDRRVRKQPAQSLSENTRTFTASCSSCQGYSHLTVLTPRTNRASFLIFAKWAVSGRATFRQISLVEYCIAGLYPVRLALLNVELLRVCGVLHVVILTSILCQLL